MEYNKTGDRSIMTNCKLYQAIGQCNKHESCKKLSNEYQESKYDKTKGKNQYLGYFCEYCDIKLVKNWCSNCESLEYCRFCCQCDNYGL